jgi:hypothetical protein
MSTKYTEGNKEEDHPLWVDWRPANNYPCPKCGSFIWIRSDSLAIRLCKKCLHPYNAAEIERLQKRPEEDFNIVVHNTGLECSNGSLKIVECNVPVDEIRQDELKCEKEIKFKTNTIEFDRYKKAIERVVMSLPYGDFEFIRKLSQVFNNINNIIKNAGEDK